MPQTVAFCPIESLAPTQLLARAIREIARRDDGVRGVEEFVARSDHETPPGDDEFHLPTHEGAENVPWMRMRVSCPPVRMRPGAKALATSRPVLPDDVGIDGYPKLPCGEHGLRITLCLCPNRRCTDRHGHDHGSYNTDEFMHRHALQHVQICCVLPETVSDCRPC